MLFRSKDAAIIPNMAVDQNRQQRASLVLKDVSYLIKAHVVVLDRRLEKNGSEVPENEAVGKHLDMFKRRARKGQYFHHPYFGCREFSVDFELIEDENDLPKVHEDLNSEKDLGYILHDIEFEQERSTKKVKKTTPHFFRAKMLNGVIRVPPLPFSIKP